MGSSKAIISAKNLFLFQNFFPQSFALALAQFHLSAEFHRKGA